MKRSTSLYAIAAIILMAEAAGPVWAQQPSTDDDQRARELFHLGENHYAAGRYEKAAVLYDEAYRLSGRPELLLALVNTYERMGDYQHAIEHLRLYLKHPKAKNLTPLRERLRRLETVEAERGAERERLRQLEMAERERSREMLRPVPQAARVSSTPASENRAPQKKSRMPAYLFLAGGAVGVAAAVTFGIMSRQAGQDAADQCVDDLCEASAQQDLDREKTYAIVADVSGIVGLASAGVGAYLLWKLRGEPTETRRALHIVPTALPGGAGIGVVSDF